MSQQIAVDQIQPNPWNRKSFDPTALQELTESIKSSGVLEPIIVRQKDGGYEIASGNRRWIAAKAAGLKEVPCEVQGLSDEQVSGMNLIANIQREDIPVLEQARMVKAYMDQFHKNQEEVAQQFGKPRTWATELVGFLDLPSKVAQNVAAATLGRNQLRALKKLAPDQQLQVAKEVKSGITKPHQVVKRANQLKFSPKSAISETPADRAVPTTKTVSVGTTVPDTTAAVLTALKDDVADAYLPTFGRVGGVLRKSLDTAWQKANGIGQMAKGLVKWGLIFSVVMWLWNPVHQWIARFMTPSSHSIAAAAPAAVVTPAPAMAKLTPAMMTTVPAPTGLKAELVSGHKVRFTWQPVAGTVGYNFYSGYKALGFQMENTSPLKENEALWSPGNGPATYRIVVTAVDNQDHESAYSEALTVDMR